MDCPVCKTENCTSSLINSREDFEIEIFKCKNCGHWFQSPERYQEIYTTGEFSKQARGGNVTPDAKKIKDLDKRALKRINYYREYIDKMDNILEIGSSIGSFVHLLKLLGKNAEGLEPDPQYASFSSSQYGFEQHQVLLADFNNPKKFDAICCFHVLEHVQQLHDFLAKCNQLLTTSGKVLFELPSLELHMYRSIKQTIWRPHIHYFTRASLYRLFSEYFKVVEIGYYGSALFVYAEKSGTATYQKSRLNSHKRKAALVRTAVKLFPGVPVRVSGITAKQFAMQSLLFQKNRKALLMRFFKFGQFAIQNKRYLNQERGTGNKKATHFSYYSAWENAGDTILSKTVRDNFKTIVPTRWDLKKVTDPVTEDTIRSINQRDYAVVGGGGLLLPDSNPNSISGWQWAISAELLDKIEVPLLVYAIGYNFFIGQKPNQLFIENLKKIIEKASFFSVRNTGSLLAVRGLVDDEIAAKVRYQPCTTTVIRKVDKNVPVKVKTRNVGVNIAFDRYHLRYGGDIYQILNQVALALKEISLAGYTIYNLCHLENDAKFELILDANEVPYQSIDLQYALPQKAYQTYCQMELVMGARGHAQMIPFGLNTRIISLGSHNKLRFFLEDIDALDWYVNLKEDVSTVSDRITGLFFKLIDSQEPLEKIEHEQLKLYQITTENYQEIKAIIN